MNHVTVAENKGRARAWLFYLMAATLVVSAWMEVGEPVKLDRVAVWLVMTALIAANLTPLPTAFRHATWARLVDDENTREHRRTAFAWGFWAAMAGAAMSALIAPAHPLAAFEVARVVLAAGLVAALTSFATLELRAAR